MTPNDHAMEGATRAISLSPLQDFIEARSGTQISEALTRVLQQDPAFRRLRVVLDVASAAPTGCGTDPSVDADEIALLREALASAAPVFSADGERVAVPLPHSGGGLLMQAESAQAAQHLLDAAADWLSPTDHSLQRTVEISELRGSLTRLEHSEQVQRALFAISDLAGSERDMDDVLKGIHAIVGTLMYAENFFIVRRDADDMVRFLYFVDVQDPVPEDCRFGEREGSLTWFLLKDGKALRGAADQLAQQVSGPWRRIGTDACDLIGVPMKRNGVVEGAIILQTYKPGLLYTAADEALLEFVGSHILTALDRKRSKEDLESSVRLRTLELAAANEGLQLEIVVRQRAERLQRALFEIAQLATVDLSEEAFYRGIHQVVNTLLRAQYFYIGLVSDDGSSLEFPYYIDSTRDELPTHRPLGRGMSEYVLRHAKPVLCRTDQILELAQEGEIELAVSGPPPACWLGVPLFIADKPVGLITVQSYDVDTLFGPADQELLGFVASQIANSLHRRRATHIQQQAFASLEERVAERTHELRNEIAERERIQEQLKHEVMHDALTGLPNRGYLRDRLERVLGLLRREPHRKAALLYMDIDRFKVINDSLGHLAGDIMLKEVAARLQLCVREPDLVARLSGDEFAILLEDVVVPETAIKVAQRILAKLAAPLLIAGKEIEPSASIGIAIADANYSAADDVLRDADIALYRAKALGRKRFELFDASLQRRAVDVLEMESDLRMALHSAQFEPYFQPIYCLKSTEVMGFEALIRWNHPTRGLLTPGDFLGIAEDSGSIEAIDWWMFERSCTLAATRFPNPNAYLTINVSPLHFRRKDFCQRLSAMLQRTGLTGTRLMIEVTEGSLLDDPEGVLDVLARLRELGVGAALDDFGTGYSSLSYLHTFPLRIVKIDRSFVSRLGADEGNSDAVVVSILALARALGMEAIAEGIETKVQHDTLLKLGCRYGQGYLLGRPAPIEHWSATK